ncbi:hypothetical protein SAMN05421791_10598, partial [Facklamia miroungae]
MKKAISSLLVSTLVLALAVSSLSGDKILAEEDTTTTIEVENKAEEIDSFVGVWRNDKDDKISLTPQNLVIDGEVHEIKQIAVNESEEEKVASFDFENFDSQEMTYHSAEDKLNFLSSDYQREMNPNIVNYVKDQLSTLEPVNLEQLLEVDENYLMAAYYQAQVDFDEEKDQIHAIYLALSQDYAELELLTEEDYE